ncbi:putative transcription regulator protein [Pseudomonas cichorii]|nr:putative transcription regulator protein [Pseudomonas cichorii]
MSADGLIKRKPRADGERNRLRIMAVAKEVFAEKGTSASLDEIAKVAGVGVGTLYRHFATRETLIGQLYENEGNQLVEAAQALMQNQAPAEALRRWLLLFVEYLSTKRIMAEVLSLLGSDADKICTVSADQLVKACQALLDNARRDGSVRREVMPLDLLFAISGGAGRGYSQNWEQAATRLVDILLAGLACEPCHRPLASDVR